MMAMQKSMAGVVKFNGEHEAGTAGNRFNHCAQTIL
jgi:hypothetical protein